MHPSRRLSLAALALLTLPLSAQYFADRSGGLDSRVKIDADLRPVSTSVPLQLARPHLPAAQQAGWTQFSQGSGSWRVLLDRRTGLPANAVGQGIPTIPGRGNTLSMRTLNARLGSVQVVETQSTTGASVDANGIRLGHMDLMTREFIGQNAAIFPGIDPAALVLNPHRSGNFGEDGYLWFVDYDQVVNGIRVEGARLTFRYNHGNLIQFGAELWDRVRPDETVALQSPEQALAAAQAHLGWDARRDTLVGAPDIKLVAAAGHRGDGEYDRDEAGKDFRGRPGMGRYTHKLLYDVTLRRAGYAGTWLLRISAKDGEVLEVRDINEYGSIKGGVYPGAATSKGTNTSLPLGFANYGTGTYADAWGNFAGTTGTTSLNGRYVKVADSCGAISKAGDASGLINLGTSTGTDCTTPGSGGAGNTHASRTGYYHTDLIKQKIRSFLPSNTWNNGQLTMNLNLNQTCNAYWNGSTINFFRSGGGCGNTGELPDVFLHEFGHGLDSNDGGVAHDGGTGEAYGDVTALTMGHHSCTGAGFLSSNCSGYGDACTNCTGIREIDYRKRAQNTPWTATKNANNCPAGSSCLGPMGKECHCEAYPITGANWELSLTLVAKYGNGAGWVTLDKLFYLSRATSGAGFRKVTATTGDGCAASNWYSTYLVVDDDDGNAANGTPNANEIYNAYNSHGIACATQVHTSTRAGATLTAPAVSQSSTASSVTLSWGAVSGASSYSIYKNTMGCSAGFIKVGSSTASPWSDSQVTSGTTFYYAVQAVGASASAISQFSTCLAVTPAGGTTTYSISGAVTTSGGAAISAVTVSTGAASATTDASGNYTISGLANGTHTVTPSKSGYSFSPVNRSVSVSGANVTGQGFTGTATTTTWSISGSAGTASASVAYSGTASGSVIADASGNYTISGLVNGTYTVTPSKTGYTFSPVNRSVSVAGANVTGQNFTATASGGGVTALSNGAGVAGSVASTSANSAWKDYSIAVPSGASNLTIATSGASGDVDLYVKFGATPSLSVYDCRPYTGSGNESCPFATPSVGTYNIRVYGYATGAINFTITASYTTGGGGAQTQRLSNAGFESGANGVWVLSGTSGITTGFARTGSYRAHFGGGDSNSYTVYQTAAIPATATAGSVSFWLNINTQESTTGTTPYDTLSASIKNSAGTTLCTLGTYSNVNAKDNGNTNGSYLQKSFTLNSTCINAIKGLSVRLHFTGTSDTSLPTTFRVDDASFMTN